MPITDDLDIRHSHLNGESLSRGRAAFAALSAELDLDVHEVHR